MSDLPIRIGHPMRQWQRECARLSKDVRFLVLVLHRRAGKTELALKKLVNAAVKNNKDLPLYFYIAPMLKQAKTIAWQRLKQMVGPLMPHVEINESDTSVKFMHNGAVIRLYGADNPDAMRGVRLDGAVIDEVAQVSNEDSFAMARRVARDEGLPVGISSGAALTAAFDIASRDEMAGKLVVAIIPSFAERYLSTPLFEGL